MIERFMKSYERKYMKGTMKGILSVAAIGWMCWGAGTACLAQTTSANLSPDLQEVVKLSLQKMSDDIITSYIKNTGHTYKLGADDIIYLNSQGVSQPVIAALLSSSTGNNAPSGQTPPPAAPANGPTPAPDASSSPQPPPLDASSAPAPVSPAPSTPPPSEPSPATMAPPPMAAPAPAGLQDNFFADGGLNPSVWQTQSSVLSGISYMGGHPVGTTLQFSPSGMQMSGIRGSGQFMGIQSMGSFAAPFNFSATVTGLAQDGIPFEVYLASADLQQWVSVAGHLGGRGSRPNGGLDLGGGGRGFFGGVRIPFGGSERSPEYGFWVNHTGSGFPIASLGYKLAEDGLAGVPYTIQISVGADGGAAVSLLDPNRGLIASQNVLVGTGPFYVVLAGRDGQTYANWQSIQLVSTAPVVTAAPTPPPVPTMDYFQSQLAPYGTWVNLPGYGLCWQPAVDPSWRPYVDGGSWTYTDAGWYWQSDYPWGDITFHYGRWAYTASGWVWVPGFDYAPAWVVWRHDDADDVVGWAPLPPGALFVDGGWQYRGVSVGADFDFGLGAGFFCFVDGGHFWDHDFRRYAIPHDRLAFVFGHSAFDDHFRYDHGRFINAGIGRDRMALLTHRNVRDIQAHRVEDIRHQEEVHNMGVRQDAMHGFHPGDRPDANRGFGQDHGNFNNSHGNPAVRQAPTGGHPSSSQSGGNHQGGNNDDQHNH
jgi:hypothetical protein